MFTPRIRRNALRTTVLAAVLLAAACASGPRQNMGAGTPPETLTKTQSVAFTRDMKVDFQNGIWGTQTMTPPQDLLLTKQGDLIGSRMSDANNIQFGTVNFMLIEPTPAQRPMYAVVAADGVPDTFIAVPMSAIRTGGPGTQVDTTVADINRVPKYTFAGLQHRHTVATNSPPLVTAAPMVVVGTPVIQPAPTITVVPGGTAVVAAPMVVAPAPSMVVAPSTETINLSLRNELVGRVVVDSASNQLGTVDYVGVTPGTMDARYLVISGNAFGPGNHVFVPTSQVHLSGGRVMVDVPVATLMQSQRFQRAELQRFVIVN